MCGLSLLIWGDVPYPTAFGMDEKIPDVVDQTTKKG